MLPPYTSAYVALEGAEDEHGLAVLGEPVVGARGTDGVEGRQIEVVRVGDEVCAALDEAGVQLRLERLVGSRQDLRLLDVERETDRVAYQLCRRHTDRDTAPEHGANPDQQHDRRLEARDVGHEEVGASECIDGPRPVLDRGEGIDDGQPDRLVVDGVTHDVFEETAAVPVTGKHVLHLAGQITGVAFGGEDEAPRLRRQRSQEGRVDRRSEAHVIEEPRDGYRDEAVRRGVGVVGDETEQAGTVAVVDEDRSSRDPGPGVIRIPTTWCRRSAD